MCPSSTKGVFWNPILISEKNDASLEPQASSVVAKRRVWDILARVFPGAVVVDRRRAPVGLDRSMNYLLPIRDAVPIGFGRADDGGKFGETRSSAARSA